MEHKIITVSQQKGGAGKTTVAVHLGVALMQRGFKVALVDVDPQGSLSAWYEARKATMGEDNVGLDCKAGQEFWHLSSSLEKLRDEYDYVVIDTPPHTKDDAQIAVKKADLVVIPIQPSPTDLWATAKTVKLANEENVNTYLLLNRVIKNSKLANRFIEDLPRSRFQSMLGNRIAFPTAMADGRTVTEISSSGAAIFEVKAVLKELLEIVDRTGDVSRSA
jgi:chromosome partitioning protein